MLGFRPMKSQQQQSPRPLPPPRRRSSSPLPVIYEDHSKSHDEDSSEEQLRNSQRSSSSSSSSASSSSIDAEHVIWPPANSPTWPPRDDEPLVRRWNDYGAVNAVNFDRFHRHQLATRSSSPTFQGYFAHHNHRGLHWMGSDVTEVTSNRLQDLHHNYTGSLNYSSSINNSNSNSEEEYSFLNDSSFHRRQRLHPTILRIWHLLSVLVMIVFCSSLFLMPSVLQQSSDGEWGGEVHGQYKDVKKMDEQQHHYYRDGTYENRHQETDRGEQQQQQQEPSWKYPKPWKYLFGMGNDDTNDTIAVTNASDSDNAGLAPKDATTAADTIQSSNDDAAKTGHDYEDNVVASLSNLTFAALASVILPPYLQTTIELCKSTIVPYHDPDKHIKSKSQKKGANEDLDAKTTSITPDQVLDLRKQILKTRDLLDAFSPVYPPHQESTYHKGDLNFETRDIQYAKFNFGLELEKDGKFRDDSHVEEVEESVTTVGKREMFGHRHGKDTKKKHHGLRDHGGSKMKKDEKYRLTKAKSTKNHQGKDLWKSLRSYLDEGYTIIGEFQDLDHAKIQYTQETLKEHQQHVWDWNVDFMEWSQKNYLLIMRYLSHACPEDIKDEKLEVGKSGKTKKNSKSSKKESGEEEPTIAQPYQCHYAHLHSSHLFWGGTLEQDLPDGNAVMARVALGRLGSAQLQRAQTYLDMLWDKDHVIPAANVDEPIEKERASSSSVIERLGRKKHPNKEAEHNDEEENHSKLDAPPREEEEEDEPPVHEVYHNLRKELRSFLDEVDLFGTLLLPDTIVRPEVIALGFASGQEINSEAKSSDVSVLGEAMPANISVSITEGIGPQVSPPVNSDQPKTTNTVHSDDEQKTFEALSSLRQTRKLLGDLNDDFTAYTSYVEWDTNLGEQVRLMSKISTEWNNFRWWARQIGLSEQIDYLISRMMADTASQVQDEAEEDAQDPIQSEQDGAATDLKDSVNVAASTPAVEEEAPAPTQVTDSNVTNNGSESPTLDSTANADNLGDLDTFLMKRKMYPTDRVVIGNDAGDADSIVSAIALSYIESTYRNGSQATPFVSIPRESFENERPEVNLLFKLAGLHDVVNELLYIQDLTEMLQGTASTQLDFTLVDQNTLNPALKRYKSQVNVVEIVDHHEDKGESIGTCHATNRTIAFDRGVALVASSCTLVVERLKSLCNADASCVYPEPLATLLIGVILIDSVNLDESIGKVTQRDRDAVVELIQHTEWKPCESKSYLVTGSNGYMYVDTGILFDTLQRAKYENSFWNNIAVERALAYDYKEFDAGLDRQNRGIFGIASILMPGSEFIAKEDFALQTLEFMRTNQLSFLAIMFAYYDSESGDTLSRQLGFCVDQTIELDSLVNDMLSSQAYKDANLGLKQVDGMPFERSDDGLHFYLFNQENVKPSRKQIGPMLEEVYEHYLMSR